MSRYPHKLFLSEVGTISSQNESGNWSPATNTMVEVGECREEPNGSGRTIILEDGKAFQFSSKIYLPVQSINFPIDSVIQVQNEDGRIRFTGKVARFTNENKHAVIWA